MVANLTLADFNILLEAHLDRMRMEEENLVHHAYRIALFNNSKKPDKIYKDTLKQYQDVVVEHSPIDIERSREVSRMIDELREVS